MPEPFAGWRRATTFGTLEQVRCCVKHWHVTTSSVTIDSVLVQDRELKTADLDGEVVVLSVRVGCYFGFNRVATEIWNMLGEPCRVGRIFDALCERHEIDVQTLTRDVMPFLQTLIEHHLVRVRDPGEMQ